MQGRSCERPCFLPERFIRISPAASASAQPIGIAAQTPVSPQNAESTYASAMRVPSEITVSTTQTIGF